MRVTVLGSGTLNPSMERGSPAYLISTKQRKILIDIGPAVLRRLFEYGIGCNDIDMIALTHFHVDHTADLAAFLFAANYGVEPRTMPLLIVGGSGSHGLYRRLALAYPWIRPKSYDLTIRTLPKGAIELGDMLVRTDRVRHNRESVAFRFEKRRSVVFSGDTDYAKGLVRLAAETDLLIADCACPLRKMKGHLNLAGLDRVVAEARPKKVLLSHLYPDWDDFQGVLHAPYLLAEDGLKIDL